MAPPSLAPLGLSCGDVTANIKTSMSGSTAHTVRVRTVYQRAGKRGAPVPVPEVRAGGLYHGAPCTAGTKVQLHRNLCVPSVPKVQLHRNLRVPSVCVKSRMVVAFRRKMTPNFTQSTKNCCYNDIFK
jgi:hypothetical protein